MANEPTNQELHNAVALLSAVLHRLEVRGIRLTEEEDRIWEKATDILQGVKVKDWVVKALINLEGIPTT